MKSWNWPRCHSCDAELGVERDTFLCADCLRALPDDLRRALLTTPAAESRGVRERALEELGGERIIGHIPRAYKPPQRNGCSCKAPRFRQANLITGGDDLVCDACGSIQRGAR